MLSRHERTDANALKIMWTAIGLIVASIVMFLSIAALFSFLKSYTEPKTLPKLAPGLVLKPKGPALWDANAAAEHKARIAKEKKLLQSYEWLDRARGIVRIPIEQAIEILAYER